MNKKYTIYKHTSPSGKSYIGQTSCNPVSLRWLPNPSTRYRTSTKLKNAINKYGWNSFSTEVLAEKISKSHANKLEAEYIKKFDTIHNGYNLQSGGNNFIHSDETKRKIGDSNRGKKRSQAFKKNRSIYQKRIMTPEYRKHLSEKCSGWSHSDEAKRKISESSIGNTNCLGRKQPEEERVRRSISAKNVVSLPCGHRRHNRYTILKCNILKLDEIQNNNDPTSFEDQIS